MRFLARRFAFLTIRHARRLIEPLVTRRNLTESQFPTAFRARPRKPVTWIGGEGIPWCVLLCGPLQYSRVLKPQRVESEMLTPIFHFWESSELIGEQVLQSPLPVAQLWDRHTSC